MATPNEHKWRYIFHFTDIHNLDSIIKNGLLCTNVKNEKGIKHKNIANMTIQERRANMDVPVGPGGKVHDYVPFYFSSINPMLLKKLNEKNVDQPQIIYLCVKIDRLDKDDAVFTDASANTSEPPSFYDDTVQLDKLDWNLIDYRKWKVGTDEDKHKKMAEALIHNSIGINEVDAIVVYNEVAKKEVERIFRENGIKAPAVIYDFDPKVRNYSFYYTKLFFSDRKGETLVVGPSALLRDYQRLIDYVKSERQKKRETYPYKSIDALVKALDKDIAILPELKDIEGLLQDYDPHNDTVDEHTKKVVSEMKQVEYYKKASEEKRNILLLASYLHDMGKGPKKKWTSGKMTSAYLDHPVDAIPMLERILIEDVETISDEEIRQVCMLVVYHDIVGDCMEKGRENQQIVDVIENEDDLDMLLAISLADAKAVYGVWGLGILGRKKAFKESIMKTRNS
jgi:hypothetical protein